MPIILGPPGTGKTTRLLGIVEQFMERGVPPDKIGYFAFTRKAANEARTRAVQRFKLEYKDLPYFSTLHALAYRQLGIRQNQLLVRRHYREIAEWLKMTHRWANIGFTDHGSWKGWGYADPFLEITTLARIMQRPLREIYSQSRAIFYTDWKQMDYVNRGIQQFKKDEHLYDYTDLLEYFVLRDVAPRLEVLVIDEAQDLCALQWRMVEKMAAHAKHVYLAGDDDQAIYRWAGADVEHFVRLDGQVEVLEKSFRIPSKHYELSQQLLKRIPGRREKAFHSREDVGELVWHRHSQEVDLTVGQWLLLARTNSAVDQLESEVRQRGMLYQRNGKSDLDFDSIRAVRIWEHLRSGGRVLAEEVRMVYSYMKTGVQIKYGFKEMPEGKDGVYYSIEDLKRNHGLMHSSQWETGLPNIPAEDRRYIELCLRRGEALDKDPRITISTIHGAKGGEADNVMLLTDVKRSVKGMWRNDAHQTDDEARVFYVGLTRSKNALHMIHPMGKAGYNFF